MESLGLNVEEISKNILNHELVWYRKKQLPLYTSVVSCLLNDNQSLNLNEVEKALASNNFC